MLSINQSFDYVQKITLKFTSAPKSGPGRRNGEAKNSCRPGDSTTSRSRPNWSGDRSEPPLLPPARAGGCDPSWSAFEFTANNGDPKSGRSCWRCCSAPRVDCVGARLTGNRSAATGAGRSGGCCCCDCAGLCELGKLKKSCCGRKLVGNWKSGCDWVGRGPAAAGRGHVSLACPLGCHGFHQGRRVVGRRCGGNAGPIGNDAREFCGAGMNSLLVVVLVRGRCWSKMGVSAWMLKVDCSGIWSRCGCCCCWSRCCGGGCCWGCCCWWDGRLAGGASSPWSHQGMVARVAGPSVDVPGMGNISLNPAVFWCIKNRIQSISKPLERNHFEVGTNTVGMKVQFSNTYVYDHEY